MTGKAIRHDKGKLKYELFSPFALEKAAEVLSWGAENYGANNWKEGMEWTRALGSLKRHTAAFEAGIDFDKQTGQLHLAHALINCMFLLDYYRSHPELDDRTHTYLSSSPRKIALDVDGVLADFSKGFKQRIKEAGLPYSEDEQIHWKFPYKAHGDLWENLIKDKDFWLNLEPVCDPHLPFEPTAYITFRDIPKEWTEEWLVKHGFPCEPVYTISGKGSKKSKLEAIKDCGADIFVDDCYETFIALNKSKVCTFLFDKPYNRKYDVGFKRIKALSDLVTGDHLQVKI